MVPRTCAQLSTVRAELILVSPRLRKRPRRRVIDTIVISQAGKRWHLGAAKFRNPKDASQTWTGRGRKPNWLVEALKKGAKMDTFAI